MRAWVLTKHGPVEGAFRLLERQDPVPGPSQVRIRSEAFGLNFADTMAVKGLYREAPPLPSVLGYEVVGRVDRLGAEAPRSLLGKRVLAMTRFGGYGELALTDHRALVIIPEDVPVGEALALATQGCTAWYAARVLCPLHAGQRVLIHSAAGGVGGLLVQLARSSGCTIIGTARGREKTERLRSQGLDHVIDRSQGFEAGLREALAGRRLDVSFNAVGGSTFRVDHKALGAGGRIVLYGGAERGALGMFGTLRFVWRMGIVLPIFLMMKSQSILGVNMLKIADHAPGTVSSCLQNVFKAYLDGELLPVVHGVFEATDLPQALAMLSSGTTVGKVVVRW